MTKQTASFTCCGVPEIGLQISELEGASGHCYTVSMVRTCTLPLTDGELRPQLEAGETLSFVGEEISFQTIERQVERLGFGDLYIVSAMQGRQAAATRIQVKPVVAAV